MGSIVENKFYNSPQMAQAASGLARLFGPPSGSDVAAYSAAQAKNEEARRLQMLFASGASPSESASLAGVQGYGQTPAGFTYNVDSRDATARYGHDQNLAGTKYTADVGAETSTANNIRDNETAVYGHDQDRLGQMFTTLFSPLDQGQVRPSVPADEAAQFGLESAIAPAQGAPKPMTEDQVRGGVLQDMVDTRALSDEMLLGLALGDSTVMVETENGPAYMNSGTAAATGAPAFVNTGAEAATETANWSTADGRGGTAYFDRATNQWTDTQTGQPIPAGATTFNAQAQGPRSDVTGATTANVTTGNMQAAEADYALERINEFQTLLEDNPGILGVPGMMRGLAQDLVAGASEFASYQGPDTVITQEMVNEITARTGASTEYDPNIAEARARALEMAYLSAKMQDPSGEVNVRELERMLGQFDGGIAGNQKVLAALTALRSQVEDRRTSADNLRSGAGAASAVPGEIPTVASPEEAAKLPSGTQFRDPDGNLRVVP